MSNKIKRRVLHLRSSGGVLGAENVVLEIAKHSEQNGWESIVGAINDVDDPYPDFLRIADEYEIKNVLFESRGKIDFKCIRKIKDFIDKWNIDIVHTHGYKENIYVLMMKSHLPKVATNHLWKTSTTKSKFYCLVDAFIIRFFDRVVGVSDEIVTKMNKLYINNTSLIANGIDIEKFKKIKSDALREQYGFHENDIILGMISSLTYEKNHKVVIEALSEINNPKLKLLIVGDGYLMESLQDFVLSSQLENNVVFVGRQDHIVEVLSLLDVFLIPSLAEGLPMAMLEAMSCEKAVIASEVGEIGKVIKHKENGLLVEPGNKSGLIEEIKSLVSNFQLISKYGENAKDTVVEKFSSKRMTAEYCALYDGLRESTD